MNKLQSNNQNTLSLVPKKSKYLLKILQKDPLLKLTKVVLKKMMKHEKVYDNNDVYPEGQRSEKPS